LRDVARAAGVSTASASRALAHPELVTAGLRGRILAAATRLGYVPNLAARTLSARRSGVVGMLVESLEEPLTAALVAAVDRQLAQAGFGLVIATAGNTPDASAPRARELLARGVDAIIFCDLQLPAEALAFATAQAVPWIALGERGNADSNSVPLGRRKGIELACRYLASLGHERFAAVATANSSLTQTVADALAGTPAKLVLAERAPHEPGDNQGLQAIASALLERSDRPTAMVCRSDLEAVAVLRECRARDISVPHEISVVGFGDSEMARHAWPALTTVRVSVDRLAAQALKRLLAAPHDQSEEAVEPSVKLVIRESSAGAPR
jgi:LacI family transcriptional regulator